MLGAQTTTRTLNVCRVIAVWAIAGGFGLPCYILLGSRYFPMLAQKALALLGRLLNVPAGQALQSASSVAPVVSLKRPCEVRFALAGHLVGIPNPDLRPTVAYSHYLDPKSM